MSLRAVLLRLLLVLALVANGLPGAMAAPAPAEVADAGHGACHDPGPAADAADPAAGMDCCDAGACSCDCLHNAPVLVTRATWPGTAPPAGDLATAAGDAPAAPPPLPSLRPPIA